MSKSKDHTPTLQAFLDAESLADAALRLGRDPLDLLAELLDTELKPAFDRRDKLAAAKEKPPRKPRRKSIEALLEIAKRQGLDVTALNPDGSVSTAPRSEGAPLLANGNDNPWDEVLHDGKH